MISLVRLLNEIDNEKFSDVSAVCPDPKDVVDYLNRVKANAPKSTKEREKFPANKPFIHAKSSFFDKGTEYVDVDEFKKKITTPPNNIINTNKKMLKTGRPNEFVYKTGIPALRGIIYDIDADKFKYINTCPGAGACVRICYARKGNYTRYAASYDSMTRRLNYLMNYPEKYEEQMYQELKAACERHKAYKSKKSPISFPKGETNRIAVRWNDSGDFFSKEYVRIAQNVIKRLEKEGYNIGDYLYTKLADVAADSGFKKAKFSTGANKRETSKINREKVGLGMVVPTDLFSDLNLKDKKDMETLKNRVTDFFGFKDRQNVISYKEMMSRKETDKPKYHVIVPPGSGDDAAYREDVKDVLNVQHN
jgi:hypothetical protein